jgi:hypothetical protein
MAEAHAWTSERDLQGLPKRRTSRPAGRSGPGDHVAGRESLSSSPPSGSARCRSSSR